MNIPILQHVYLNGLDLSGYVTELVIDTPVNGISQVHLTLRGLATHVMDDTVFLIDASRVITVRDDPAGPPLYEHASDNDWNI